MPPWKREKTIYKPPVFGFHDNLFGSLLRSKIGSSSIFPKFWGMNISQVCTWEHLGRRGWKPQHTQHIPSLPLSNTLQGINISHLRKRKIIFKMPFLGGYVSSLEGRSFQKETLSVPTIPGFRCKLAVSFREATPKNLDFGLGFQSSKSLKYHGHLKGYIHPSGIALVRMKHIIVTSWCPKWCMTLWLFDAKKTGIGGFGHPEKNP